MDVGSRYKGSYQLATKNSKEVSQAFQWIYENKPLTYPKTLIIYYGKEFYGDMTKLMEKQVVMYYTPAHFSELECVHYHCVVMYTHAVLLAH